MPNYLTCNLFKQNFFNRKSLMTVTFPRELALVITLSSTTTGRPLLSILLFTLDDIKCTDEHIQTIISQIKIKNEIAKMHIFKPLKMNLHPTKPRSKW